MKKIVLLSCLSAIGCLHAQFNVQIKIPAEFNEKEAILYTLNGSKDIISSKGKVVNNTLAIKYPTRYLGMMKVYFPNTNNNLNFISENKDVSIVVETKGNNKISKIQYLDDANNAMNETQKLAEKKEIILPALAQITEYYNDNSSFAKALSTEMDRLGKPLTFNSDQHPFINFYYNGYNKFLSKKGGKEKPSQDEIINYIDKAGDMLESSSLMRPILVEYLNGGGNTNINGSVDKILGKLNVETPRGQVVLSELIEIFDVYAMSETKEKYLSYAKNLKCTINDRLNMTIKSNDNIALGATFQNYDFKSPLHTKAKSLYDVKANNKIVVFWSSTCSHCESELPQLLKVYNELKSKNVEIVGFSLDTSKDAFLTKAGVFPWINDTELKGWNSDIVNTYNLLATPTYFILDANNKIINKPDRVGDVLTYFKLK